MKKILYIMIGCISLGLGIIGVILPILPTVPFVLLATFCFAKSSERLDGWFKNTKLYKENNIKSGMTKRAKIRIMCSVTLLMSIGFIMMGLRRFPKLKILHHNPRLRSIARKQLLDKYKEALSTSPLKMATVLF